MRHLLLALILAAIAPAAKAQEPPAYLLVIGRTLDRAQMGAYAAALAPIYAANQGGYVGLGRPGAGASCLEGPCQERSVILARFASGAGLDGFWWGQDYRRTIRLRDRAGVFDVVAIAGAPAIDPFPGAASGHVVLLLGPTAGLDARAAAFKAAAAQAGGRVIADAAPAPLEGDQPWAQAIIASFPTVEAREAFLAGRIARNLAKRRAKDGPTMLVTINGFGAPPQR